MVLVQLAKCVSIMILLVSFKVKCLALLTLYNFTYLECKTGEHQLLFGSAARVGRGEGLLLPSYIRIFC